MKGPGTYLPRLLERDLLRSVQTNPATAILGPRQCGKSTLVKELLVQRPDTLYLDLERPSDLQKLAQAEWYLSSQSARLICLDEVQRQPEIFPLLRSLIDEQRRPGMYLVLGSASRDLIQQSSESLAGRIRFLSLTPFLWEEVKGQVSLETYLYRGGFPPSLLAQDDEASFEWRQDFITTFLERDLLQFAGFTPTTMRRLWQMLAHSNGETVNLSKMGTSLGVSQPVIRRYLDLLEGTFMLRQIAPFEANVKKRLVKSPKVYLSDVGLTAALLNLKTFDQIMGHPGFGTLWETKVLHQLTGHFPRVEIAFYRTSAGAEIDFALRQGFETLAIECKASVSPNLTKGNHAAIRDVDPVQTLVVAPVEQGYSAGPKLEVVGLTELVQRVQAWLG